MQCKNCNSLITSLHAKVFCTRSCSASYNNRGKTRKRSRPLEYCIVCGNLKASVNRKFCSIQCSSESRKKTDEYKRAKNAQAQSHYRAKKYRVVDPSANKEKILEFYKNRPAGYEVDHIIPLSRGGKHHEDNLQYLLKEDNRKKNNRFSL
jgi:hypothetical protein